jgi:hypothetical protein
MAITVHIQRTKKRLALLRNKDTKDTKAAFEIWGSYGYKHISALDVKNFNEVPWDGVEYNNLLEKGGILYKFVEWLGHYPFDGIVIENIGTCSIN